jgi:hypothetical protein
MWLEAEGEDEDGLQWLLSLPCVQMLKDDVRLVHKVLASISNDAQWTLIKEDDGIKTYFKQEDGSPICSIKIKAIMDADLVDVLCTLGFMLYFSNIRFQRLPLSLSLSL